MVFEYDNMTCCVILQDYKKIQNSSRMEEVGKKKLTPEFLAMPASKNQPDSNLLMASKLFLIKAAKPVGERSVFAQFISFQLCFW